MNDCRTLFDSSVHVHYGQMYVLSDVEFPDDPARALDGQGNGICGAQLSGLLFLVTGTHTGRVPVRVEAWEREPPLDASWEDIVEAYFEPLTDDVAMVEWAGETSFDLALERQSYAVRYCASGMDAARLIEGSPTTMPKPDRYLLQFWPSTDESRDLVVREGSRFAARRRSR